MIIPDLYYLNTAAPLRRLQPGPCRQSRVASQRQAAPDQSELHGPAAAPGTLCDLEEKMTNADM